MPTSPFERYVDKNPDLAEVLEIPLYVSAPTYEEVLKKTTTPSVKAALMKLFKVVKQQVAIDSNNDNFDIIKLIITNVVVKEGFTRVTFTSGDLIYKYWIRNADGMTVNISSKF